MTPLAHLGLFAGGILAVGGTIAFAIISERRRPVAPSDDAPGDVPNLSSFTIPESVVCHARKDHP